MSWSHEGAFLPGFLRRKGITFGMIAAFPDYRVLQSRRAGRHRVKGLADRWFRKRPLQKADVVFALSTYTAGQLTELMGVDPKRIRRTYWGVPPAFLEIHRPKRSNISRLVYFGALTESKGVGDLLGALARVREQGETAWELRIAGWGDENGLRQAASELGIIGQVKILGRLSHEELLPVLEWADLAILPSRAESFGLAIAEAQAAGLPVIACKTGAVPEIVEDGLTGWLVEPGDSQAIASALLAAMHRPEQAFDMGMAGRKRVANRFTWRATAEAMAQGLFEPAAPPIAA
jgi:glycosyltransferase involved in cell wall biosynthesis